VSRRRRALLFVLAAAVAAAAAAAIADRYGERVAEGYGALRPVVVARAGLVAARPIDPGQVAAALEVRRVPARFVPGGALADPAEAIGLAPSAAIPAGSYLLAAQLRPPRRRRGGSSSLPHGRHPVEIAVSGAEALLLGGAQPIGRRVDVIVTTEPSGSGPGRTYVAAAAVPLLELAAGVDGIESEGLARATLGLTRGQALRLIAAESFARRLTLLARD
jgi:Flp pilus assembly protein CpaB